jgi:hypothetical protein
VIEFLVQKRRNRALDETLTTAISALVDIDCRQPAASWRAQLRAALRRDGSLAGRCRNRCRSTSPAIPKGPRLADGNRRAVPKPQAFFITSRVAVVLRAASAGPVPAAEGPMVRRLPAGASRIRTLGPTPSLGPAAWVVRCVWQRATGPTPPSRSPKRRLFASMNLARTFATSSVVPLVIRNTPSASRWRAPSATTSAARLPNTTTSLAEVDAARMQHSLSFPWPDVNAGSPAGHQRSSPNRPIAGSFSAGTAASMPILSPSTLSSSPSSMASRTPARP